MGLVFFSTIVYIILSHLNSGKVPIYWGVITGVFYIVIFDFIFFKEKKLGDVWKYYDNYYLFINEERKLSLYISNTNSEVKAICFYLEPFEIDDAEQIETDNDISLRKKDMKYISNIEDFMDEKNLDKTLILDALQRYKKMPLKGKNIDILIRD